MSDTRTINIRLPAGTNIDELLSLYSNLCVARGVQTTLPNVGSGAGFSHPIAESRQMLLDDFMTFSELLSRLSLQYQSVSVSGARVYNNLVTFMLETNKETQHVLFPEQH